MKRTKEEIQQDLDGRVGVEAPGDKIQKKINDKSGSLKESIQNDLDRRAGIKTGDLMKIDPAKAISKKDMNQTADILKESLHKYCANKNVMKFFQDQMDVSAGIMKKKDQTCMSLESAKKYDELASIRETLDGVGKSLEKAKATMIEAGINPDSAANDEIVDLGEITYPFRKDIYKTP